MIHDGSLRDGHVEPRGSEACSNSTSSGQARGLSFEGASQQRTMIAAEALMNHAGLGSQVCTASAPREGSILLSLVERVQARRANIRLTKNALRCPA